MPLLVQEPWFKPKQKQGWGLIFANNKGRLATFIFAFILGLGVLLSIVGKGKYGAGLIIIDFVVFAITVALTGERPGGPGLHNTNSQ
jgi:hypothetical protein